MTGMYPHPQRLVQIRSNELFRSGRPQTSILLLSAPPVSRITGVSHHVWLCCLIFHDSIFPGFFFWENIEQQVFIFWLKLFLGSHNFGHKVAVWISNIGVTLNLFLCFVFCLLVCFWGSSYWPTLPISWSCSLKYCINNMEYVNSLCIGSTCYPPEFEGV
jgi:hypothetical protein